MFAAMKRLFLALALGAALVALPASIALAAASDGNELDDYSGPSSYGGAEAQDSYVDDRPYTSPAPGGDGYIDYDDTYVPSPTSDCPAWDPCAPN
jgi:hypothetical protein